jgi:hypothetical protein
MRVVIPILLTIAGILWFFLAPSKLGRPAALLLTATGVLFLISVSHCPDGTCTATTPWWSSAAGALAGICAIGVICSLLAAVAQTLIDWVRRGSAPR